MRSSVNLAPANKSKPAPIIIYMTFDIGLGEQHKLNCLQQRGTWKASWDGLGKYTEFYPAIGMIGSNTSKCILCCQMKDALCLVRHFRPFVCSLHRIAPQNCHRRTSVFTNSSMKNIVFSLFRPSILYWFGSTSPHVVMRGVGIERHCIPRLCRECSVWSMSRSYFPKFFSFTCCPFFIWFLPIFLKFESRKISKKGSLQCNVIKTCCTVSLKNIVTNLVQECINYLNNFFYKNC